MARRGRQSSMKALGPGHRHRNKNPKLSPYQRELKRNRLANQAPRPFVNASASQGGKKAPVTADSLNLSLMYQKRDTPAKARGLMKFLQDKEDRAKERQKAKEEAELKKQQEEEEEAKQILEYRERNENSDFDTDAEEDEEDAMFDGEEDEENESEVEEAADNASSQDEGLYGDTDMEGMLAELEEQGSDSEIIDDEDDGNVSKVNSKMVLTKVPENPSGKQLKAWMVKKERLAYLEMKEKGDAAGCEALLKKVLIGQGFSFVDPKTLEKANKSTKKADNSKNNRQPQQNHRRQRGKPITEGELSAPLSNLNEEMEQQMAPNLAAVNANKTAVASDGHDARMAESAMINLKLLKKKEKKHAKKSEKRRERTMEEMNTIETEMNQAMSKKHKKKVLKEKMKEGDANYKLHQQLTNKQIENLKAGIGAKRQREEGDGHDPNFLLPFQVYEQQQQQKQVKRLSGLDESQLQRAVDLDDAKGKVVEKIRFGERAEAPPVFNVVPSMSNSFAKFAMKLQNDSTKKAATPKATSSKVNGVVTSNGGVRAQQNKPGKAKEMALANKTILKNAMARLQQQSNSAVSGFARNENSGIISTAARVDSTGDISLYERKRLAKLGLMGPVTEQRINRSGVANGGEGNSAHNASEMEMLRQRVMSTYQKNKKARKEGGGNLPAPVASSNTKSWMPTDRDY